MKVRSFFVLVALVAASTQAQENKDVVSVVSAIEEYSRLRSDDLSVIQRAQDNVVAKLNALKHELPAAQELEFVKIMTSAGLATAVQLGSFWDSPIPLLSEQKLWDLVEVRALSGIHDSQTLASFIRAAAHVSGRTNLYFLNTLVPAVRTPLQAMAFYEAFRHGEENHYFFRSFCLSVETARQLETFQTFLAAGYSAHYYYQAALEIDNDHQAQIFRKLVDAEYTHHYYFELALRIRNEAQTKEFHENIIAKKTNFTFFEMSLSLTQQPSLSLEPYFEARNNLLYSLLALPGFEFVKVDGGQTFSASLAKFLEESEAAPASVLIDQGQPATSLILAHAMDINLNSILAAHGRGQSTEILLQRQFRLLDAYARIRKSDEEVLKNSPLALEKLTDTSSRFVNTASAIALVPSPLFELQEDPVRSLQAYATAILTRVGFSSVNVAFVTKEIDSNDIDTKEEFESVLDLTRRVILVVAAVQELKMGLLGSWVILMQPADFPGDGKVEEQKVTPFGGGRAVLFGWDWCDLGPSYNDRSVPGGMASGRLFHLLASDKAR